MNIEQGGQMVIWVVSHWYWITTEHGDRVLKWIVNGVCDDLVAAKEMAEKLSPIEIKWREQSTDLWESEGDGGITLHRREMNKVW
jgi:hypothetical protein